ncbi:hypothetical protein LZ30DRAFT_785573 [Colletotrichum cereale]|nr:hypothetical protein LZ30DRAFT_785573 [Colletotrichum cereale]
MAANGRTSLLNKMPDRGLTGRDWPDHFGLRALHYAACCSAADWSATAASELVEALIRVGARMHDSRRSSQRHYAPARRLVADFRQAADSTGAASPILSPDFAPPGGWMDTVWQLRSGGLVEIDDEVFSGPRPATALTDYAIARRNHALATVFWAVLGKTRP